MNYGKNTSYQNFEQTETNGDRRVHLFSLLPDRNLKYMLDKVDKNREEEGNMREK